MEINFVKYKNRKIRKPYINRRKYIVAGASLYYLKYIEIYYDEIFYLAEQLAWTGEFEDILSIFIEILVATILHEIIHVFEPDFNNEEVLLEMTKAIAREVLQ